MSRNGKKYFEFHAAHSLSDSSDEEEFFVRSSKTQKTKVTSDALSSRSSFHASLEKNENCESFHDQISTDNIAKAMEMLMEMTRKNIENWRAKVKVLMSRQISELDDATKKYMDGLMYEINRWKIYNDNIKHEEGKLLEVFQKLKNKYYLMRTENNKFKRVRKIHEIFIKEHGEIMNKYETEADALKDDIIREISDIKRILFQEYQIGK